MMTDSKSLSFEDALRVLRKDIDHRSQRTRRVNTLCEVARQHDVSPNAVGHPRITQALFRYAHFPPSMVRGEIEQANEIYHLGAALEEVVEVIVSAAVYVGSTDESELPH